jgi:AraC-like DNA-binding protein
MRSRHGSTRPSGRERAASAALEDCRIQRVSFERVASASVEIVEADAQNRCFGDRVTETLGLCLKLGPDHDVMANGKLLRYPRDTICVRGPGCVWATPSTGPVGFLSLDFDLELLPEAASSAVMRFVAPEQLPDLRGVAALLRSAASDLHKQTKVAELIEAVAGLGIVPGPAPTAAPRSAADDARELLASSLETTPSLRDLAAAVGANRFVLLREFRRRFGLPPHAYVLKLKVERAKARLARGDDIVDVAFALGFSDQSHFTRVFRRVMGLPPGAYRRRTSCARLTPER